MKSWPDETKKNTTAIAEISLNDAKGKMLRCHEKILYNSRSLLRSVLLAYNVDGVGLPTAHFSLRAYFRQYTKMQIGICGGHG